MPETGPTWKLSLAGEATVCVAPTLAQMTPYVLLEQEDWFEDEIRFVRRLVEPGMTMLDVGANHGVYSLAAACRIGGGRIWAFEPASAPRARFAESVALNGFGTVVAILPVALSDTERTVEMAIAENSELGSLHGGAGPAETVRVRTLDACAAEHFPDARIDFVKLDAEGEEVAILRGGARIFAEQSPLVMFELREGAKVNAGLPEAFRALGYDLFVLVAEAGLLLPATGAEEALNLFACKPDRAAALAARGLLLRSEAELPREPAGVSPADLAERLGGLECAAAWRGAWNLALVRRLPGPYMFALGTALAAASAAPARRVALWLAAWTELARLPAAVASRTEVDLLRLHLLHCLGRRAAAHRLARTLERQFGTRKAQVDWPFVAPLAADWRRATGQTPETWAAYRVAEYVTIHGAASSYFLADIVCGRVGLHLGDPDRSARICRTIALATAKRLRRGEGGGAVVMAANAAAWRDLSAEMLYASMPSNSTEDR
ncbi:hypothetical protein KL86APRO_20533 [uncultured Alphaproteobacteria bacterium]|uniref:Methyltransferase FkbM domain-containing protein n=1 Tax=uncultured Alphaproteobacteria bacterium TaxID=91750 RepID=A0A212KKV8_9PROT|nr:hypothetical protein KL86APRO_20533 [uncultured Alphaproteobacteria bacterium]